MIRWERGKCWFPYCVSAGIISSLLLSLYQTTKFFIHSNSKHLEVTIYITFILSSANAFNLEKVKFLSSGNGLRGTENWMWLRLWILSHSWLKTLPSVVSKAFFLQSSQYSEVKLSGSSGKFAFYTEKMLITSNLSLSHHVFKSGPGQLVKVAVCKLFPFGRVQNSSFGRGLRLWAHAKKTLRVVWYRNRYNVKHI